MDLSHQTTSPTPVQSAISGPYSSIRSSREGRAHLCQARLLNVFTGEYDRAEGDLRTAMRFHCADRNVKEEGLALRALGVVVRMDA